MTKENAKGVTLDARAKIAVLIDTLCNSGLVDVQANDPACRVEYVSDAVGLLTKARISLSKAYGNDYRVREIEGVWNA